VCERRNRVSDEQEFERRIVFEPAYDRRADGYGQHGVELRMYVIGPLGAVQFALSTGWPHPSVLGLDEPDHLGMWAHAYQDGFREQNEWRMDGRARGHYPSPSDLGYHSPRPMYEGQQPITDSCEFVGGAPCYYDGSGLNAAGPFHALVTGGNDAVWAYLEDYYRDVFEQPAAVSPADTTEAG
jgi:hypothetical protein